MKQCLSPSLCGWHCWFPKSSHLEVLGNLPTFPWIRSRLTALIRMEMIFSCNLQVTRKDVLPSASVGSTSYPCPPFSLWRSLTGTSVFVQLAESTSCIVAFIGRRPSLRTWLELCLQGVLKQRFACWRCEPEPFSVHFSVVLPIGSSTCLMIPKTWRSSAISLEMVPAISSGVTSLNPRRR